MFSEKTQNTEKKKNWNCHQSSTGTLWIKVHNTWNLRRQLNMGWFYFRTWRIRVCVLTRNDKTMSLYCSCVFWLYFLLYSPVSAHVYSHLLCTYSFVSYNRRREKWKRYMHIYISRAIICHNTVSLHKQWVYASMGCYRFKVTVGYHLHWVVF